MAFKLLIADFSILANLSTVWDTFEISFETLEETHVKLGIFSQEKKSMTLNQKSHFDHHFISMLEEANEIQKISYVILTWNSKHSMVQMWYFRINAQK